MKFKSFLMKVDTLKVDGGNPLHDSKSSNSYRVETGQLSSVKGRRKIDATADWGFQFYKNS